MTRKPLFYNSVGHCIPQSIKKAPKIRQTCVIDLFLTADGEMRVDCYRADGDLSDSKGIKTVYALFDTLQGGGSASGPWSHECLNNLDIAINGASFVCFFSRPKFLTFDTLGGDAIQFVHGISNFYYGYQRHGGAYSDRIISLFDSNAFGPVAHKANLYCALDLGDQKVGVIIDPQFNNDGSEAGPAPADDDDDDDDDGGAG